MSKHTFTTQMALRMMKLSVMAFRAGWIRGMKNSADGRQDLAAMPVDCLPEYSREYTYGYRAACLHWLGKDSRKVEHARMLGLIDEYEGFWGQAGWRHPSP